MPPSSLTLMLCPLLGAAGGAYPKLLLGEPRPPGLVAGLLLGIVAGLALAPVWATPAAIRATAGANGCSPRVVLFAHGRAQLTTRLAELLAVLVWCAGRSLLAGVGGVAEATAAGVAHGGLSWGPHLAPAAMDVLRALAVAAAACTLGWLVGLTSRSGAAGHLVYVGAIAGSVLLAGAAYFARVLGPVASAAPAGLLLTSLRAHLLAAQFTDPLSDRVATVGAVAWGSLLLVSAGLRVRRAVR